MSMKQVKEAKRIMHLVAYGKGNDGHAWDKQDWAARKLLGYIQSLEKENARLRACCNSGKELEEDG